MKTMSFTVMYTSVTMVVIITITIATISSITLTMATFDYFSENCFYSQYIRLVPTSKIRGAGGRSRKLPLATVLRSPSAFGGIHGGPVIVLTAQGAGTR